jgi:hypothetical protein
MVQLLISAFLINMYEHNYVHFRFHIRIIADTDQGQDGCWLKFHWIRIHSKGVFFGSFHMIYGDIYVLKSQDLVIVFPSFHIKDFHYVCFKWLF